MEEEEVEEEVEEVEEVEEEVVEGRIEEGSDSSYQ